MLARLDMTKFSRIETLFLLALQRGGDAFTSNHDLLALIYGERNLPTRKMVTVMVCLLRKKLSGTGLEIQSERGRGYRLREVADA